MYNAAGGTSGVYESAERLYVCVFRRLDFKTAANNTAARYLRDGFPGLYAIIHLIERYFN